MVLNLLRDTDFNDRQLAIIQMILSGDKEVFSVTGVEHSFGVSNQTARNDLNDLVARGILQTRKNGKQVQYLPVENAVKKIQSAS